VSTRAIAPTAALIQAQAAAILERWPEELVIGFHSPSPWQSGGSVLAGGKALRVRTCQSSIEIREALIDAEQGEPIVFVTPLRDEDLEADVRARLARRRINVIRPWETVRDVFKLRDLDSRLDGEAWMAERLLEAHAAGGGPVVPSGFLDLDTAWEMVAASLELPSGRPDALELLRWADDHGLAQFQAAGEVAQAALRRRVLETAGPAGEAILGCLASGLGTDVLALGLVCGVVFHRDAPPEGRIALERAAVRLERYSGHRAVSAAAGRAWAAAAEALVEDLLRERGLQHARPLLQRADALLREVEAQDQAHLGRFSLLGFEQRLARLAARLDEALSQPGAEAAPRLREALRSVREHGLAAAQPERVVRAEMALRLLRWLGRAAEVASPASFEEAATRYAADTGFADRVRATLEAGDGCEPLSAAYNRLLSRVADRREAENERFGRLLAEWVATGGSLREALRIEDVLTDVVGPLAARGPVLLLVVDGMSLAIYREVAEDLVREGWIELASEGHPAVRPVIAALPTVTEVSRASLLCGRLGRGLAADERAGFAAHSDLLKHTGRKKPPVLFHKADLGEGGETGLATAVRAELADPDRRVVAVVVNAVDDHLAKGDQIRPRWGIETIGPLRTVLHAAQQAGRTVVVTSDHGHVPERGSEARSYPEAQRWRAADPPPGSGEVAVHGGRVVIPAGGRLVAPWSELLRYGGKKNGYHGGVSPQEVVVPLGVFTPGLEVEAWVEVASTWPAWWTEEQAVQAPAPRRPLRKKAEQTRLFPTPTAAGASPGDGWIEALLKSPVWKAQLQMAGRVSGEVDRLRQALLALDERGGKLTRQALGHRLGLAPVRVGGFVAGLRRVLNVDGYDVLEVDDASDTVTLNRELLRKQFELP
jgi:hypothetical protein